MATVCIRGVINNLQKEHPHDFEYKKPSQKKHFSKI